ncbi:hypothetical protein E2P65_05180, partial [Candidatus Bathyarchaeota archaeon]
MIMEKPWALTESELLTQLETSADGLTTSEAKERLSRFGPNTIGKREVRTAPFILLSQFKNPLVLLLILSSAVTMLIGHLSDALIIIGIVLINSCLGFYQEYRSEKAVEQ